MILVVIYSTTEEIYELIIDIVIQIIEVNWTIILRFVSHVINVSEHKHMESVRRDKENRKPSRTKQEEPEHNSQRHIEEV